MATQNPQHRKHLIPQNTSTAEKYTAKPQARDPEPATPAKGRDLHGAHLRAQLAAVAIVQQQRTAEMRAADVQSAIGIQIEFESEHAVALAAESLARDAQGIELMNVQRREGQVLATVFVPEGKLAHFEKQAFSPSVNRDKEYQTEIGHLKYQNEQNRTQKAAMASSLSQKDIEIKQLQLALVASKDALDAAKKSAQSHANIIGERDYLQDQVREERLGRDREIAALAEAKSSEIQNLT
ncbi:MAG: hypothetical protein EON56_04785, partial [Alphaproteobacteria bacterium]